MVLGFWDLDVPIVGAPMAGGPGTPALAAAVSNAGGLGFLAGGYISADRLADDIAAARAATTGPIGVKLPISPGLKKSAAPHPLMVMHSVVEGHATGPRPIGCATSFATSIKMLEQ